MHTTRLLIANEVYKFKFKEEDSRVCVKFVEQLKMEDVEILWTCHRRGLRDATKVNSPNFEGNCSLSFAGCSAEVSFNVKSVFVSNYSHRSCWIPVGKDVYTGLSRHSSPYGIWFDVVRPRVYH